ncbi:MAG: LysR family transcriptional regulator, partial [Anaerovoracaceae bacterium]
MELRVLRYFLAVAREQNITAAAETLHVTQPTLSKQLMELEKELGRTLFIRGNRKITLTEDGMFLRKRAQEITELVDKTEAAFTADSETIVGEIFIGSGETEAIRYIAKSLSRLQALHPGVTFNLYSGNGEDVSERLDKGLLDFGLFVGMTDLKKYDYLTLPCYHRWGLIMRKDDSLAKEESITPDMLPGLPLLCSRQALIQNELSGWLGIAFEELNIIGTYNLIYNAAVMVEEG